MNCSTHSGLIIFPDLRISNDVISTITYMQVYTSTSHNNDCCACRSEPRIGTTIQGYRIWGMGMNSQYSNSLLLGTCRWSTVALGCPSWPALRQTYREHQYSLHHFSLPGQGKTISDIIVHVHTEQWQFNMHVFIRFWGRWFFLQV